MIGMSTRVPLGIPDHTLSSVDVDERSVSEFVGPQQIIALVSRTPVL